MPSTGKSVPERKESCVKTQTAWRVQGCNSRAQHLVSGEDIHNRRHRRTSMTGDIGRVTPYNTRGRLQRETVASICFEQGMA